jgi:hypothetical protein
LLAAAVSVALLSTCGPDPATLGVPFEPSDGSAPVVVAVGDISCPGEPCEEQLDTAAVVERIDPDALLLLGDIQYKDGKLADFEGSFEPSWGRFVDIAYPVPGNHEYHVADAQGYFDYFGSSAHAEQGGWYSFDIGEWHLIAVNSGSGDISEEQRAWIEADLASDGHGCELAYWHHPRWSSGTVHGPDPEPDMDALWRTLHAAGVDLVLNGHEHNYERFAPLDPDERLDPDRGIRQFVAGTGGRSLYEFGEPKPGSERRIDDSFGVLELTLGAEGYAWRFVSSADRVLDEGSGDCHA